MIPWDPQAATDKYPMAHLVAPGRLEHPARAEPPEKSVSYMVLAWFLHVLYMLIYVASFAHGFECFACVCVCFTCCCWFPEFPMGLSKDNWTLRNCSFHGLYFRQSLTGDIPVVCEKHVGNAGWLVVQKPGKSWNMMKHDDHFASHWGAY